MHDAALSVTCKSCVPPATFQQAQRSSSGTLSQGLVIHTRRHRKSYKIGGSNALASKARKQRRMCRARGLHSWKTSKLFWVAKRVPICQGRNEFWMPLKNLIRHQQVASPASRFGTLTSSSRIYSSKNQQDKVIETAWKVLISLGFTIKRQNPLCLESPFEVEQ